MDNLPSEELFCFFAFLKHECLLFWSSVYQGQAHILSLLLMLFFFLTGQREFQSHVIF